MVVSAVSPPMGEDSLDTPSLPQQLDQLQANLIPRGRQSSAPISHPPSDPESSSSSSSDAGGDPPVRGGGGYAGGNHPPSPSPFHPLGDMDPALMRSVMRLGHITTLKLIPKRARPVVTEILAMLVHDLGYRTFHRTSERAPFAAAWKLFLAGYPSVPEIRARAALITASRWRELKELVLESLPSRPRGKRSRTGAARAAATAGRIGKAMRVLSQIHPPCKHSPNQLRSALVTYHPHASKPLPAPVVYPAPPADALYSPIREEVEAQAERLRESGRSSPTLPWHTHVAQVIRMLRRGTAPGPSGLRVEHLRLAVIDISSPACDAVADFIDLMLGGLVPQQMCAATLSGMPKPNNDGIRPIAAGETLRKVAARMEATALRRCLGDSLETHGQQFALSKHGSLKVYDTVRKANAEGKVVVKIDVKNAFNAVELCDIVNAIEQAISSPQQGSDVNPQSVICGSPFVRALYCQSTTLWLAKVDADPIVSERGVAQGCPLSTLLFSNLMSRLLQRAHASYVEQVVDPEVHLVSDPVSSVSFADDCYIMASSPEAIKNFMAILKLELDAVGLVVNSSKCQYIFRSADCDPTLDQLGVAVNLMDVMGGPVPALHLPRAQRVALVKDYAWKTITQKASVVSAATQFEDPQHAWGALCHCGMFSRTYHLFTALAMEKSLSASELRNLMCAAESVDMAVLAETLGAFGFEFGPNQWVQATLAVSQGGLGISSISANADAFTRAAAALQNVPPSESTATKALCNSIRDQRSRALAALQESLSPQDALRLADLCLPGAGAWIRGSATASSVRGTLMQADVAQAALAIHLGIPVFPQYDVASPIPRCPEGDSCRHRCALEPSGRHTIQCALPTSRHNAVRDVLFSLAFPVAFPGSAQREQGLRGDAPPTDDVVGIQPELHRPGDVTYRLYQQPRRTFVDVTIAGVHQDDTRTVRLARRAESAKEATFRQRHCGGAGGSGRGDGVHFVPLGISVFGTFGPSASAEIKRLGQAYRTMGVELLAESPFDEAEIIRQRLATTVVSANATEILRVRELVGITALKTQDVLRRGNAPRAVVAQRHAGDAGQYRGICEKKSFADEGDRLLPAPIVGSERGIGVGSGAWSPRSSTFDLVHRVGTWPHSQDALPMETRNINLKFSVNSKVVVFESVDQAALRTTGRRRRFIGALGEAVRLPQPLDPSDDDVPPGACLRVAPGRDILVGG